jgi:biopolymer transport protein ExbD
MGMSSAGGGGSAKPNINVTPLIDVLLVLLIIFMVITPSKPSQFEANVPPEPTEDEKEFEFEPNPNALIVIFDTSARTVTLNQDVIQGATVDGPEGSQPLLALTQRLENIFSERSKQGILRSDGSGVEKTVFVRGAKEVKYGDIVKIIDAIKLSGAEPIGLQIDDLSDK